MRAIEVLTLNSRRSYGVRRHRCTAADLDRHPLRGRRTNGWSETAGQGRGAPTSSHERCDGRLPRNAEPRRLGGLHRQRDEIAQDDPRRPRLRAESKEPHDAAADDVQERDRETGEGLTTTD